MRVSVKSKGKCCIGGLPRCEPGVRELGVVSPPCRRAAQGSPRLNQSHEVIGCRTTVLIRVVLHYQFCNGRSGEAIWQK